jgi:hypothetical protein
MKTVYVCTGGCRGKVSAEEYAAGKTTCGTEGCPNFGHTFEKREECEICGAVVLPGTPHEHRA